MKEERAYPCLSEATWVWARIALLSFGGPAGQIAVMHRILVEEKRWLGDGRFLHALNFSMLLPGPEAQQLATYVGWLMHGTRGAVIAGGLFILPGVVSIMALSWIYAVWGDVGLVSGLFFGLKAAILAIVLQAVVRVARKALRNGPMRLIAVLSFIAIFALAAPFPLIVATAALIGFLGARAGLAAFAGGGGHGAMGGAHVADAETLLGEEARVMPPEARRGALTAGLAALALWLVPVMALFILLGPGNVFADIALFFSKMAVVTFGGAYAVLAYVAQEAVGTYGWLAPGEMLDGLGMAETTPGPLIMVLQFVGFMGALRANRALSAALTAVTAAVVGVILNLAIWFAIHVIWRQSVRWESGPLSIDLPVLGSVDWAAAALTALAVIAVFRLRFGMVTTLGGAAVSGMCLSLLGYAG